jgi:N-acetylmuramoyl-L-alanine amidase
VFARHAHGLALVTVAIAAVGLSGCSTAGTPTAAVALTTSLPTTTASSVAPTTPPPTTSSAIPTTTTRAPSPSPKPLPPAPAANGHGQVVVLDPGHDGGNASHPAEINQLVPAGRGITKACNTTGTATNAGYSEHEFTWDVANRVRTELLARGYQVVMTRSSDAGVGPCVNQRAAIGNQAQAAAVVSIHGDGSLSGGARGFHVEYSNPPLNAAQGAPAMKLATTIRDTVRSAGFSTANYIGSNGLFGTPGLGGLNLSTQPAALIECGNMRDSGDAAYMTSPDGRQRIADALTTAIIAYLGG